MRHKESRLEKAGYQWKGRHCLVTGAYGFVGTHLCRELLAREAKVTALDCLESAAGTYLGLAGLNRRLDVVKADVRSARDLRALEGRPFDCVFHLAAQPISPLSNLDPDRTMEVNAAGTTQVGRIVARQRKPPTFVFASSACWYGATIHSPLRESEAGVEGEYKYTESKVEAERRVLALESRHGVPTIRCRFVNLYGPGDRHFSRIIPKTIRHLIRGERPRLTRNDGSTVLDYLFVSDAISALLLAAEKAEVFRGEVFNFGIGSEHAMSAVELVERACLSYPGEKRRPILESPTEPRTKKKFLDATKARVHLGWRPTTRLDQGLPQAIRWYQKNLERIEQLEY